MDPQPDRVPAVAEVGPAPQGLLGNTLDDLLEGRRFADLEADRRLERELLEAELGGGD